MATSGTYNFINVDNHTLLMQAYRRAGVRPEEIVKKHIDDYKVNANLLLSSWANDKDGLKLWTIQTSMISLVPFQNTYDLPLGTIDLLEVNLRTSVRNLGGTPGSAPGGVPQNAFDGNSNTHCDAGVNGNISYNWGTNSYAIQMVGVCSNTDTTYTLVFEYSDDGVTWTQVYAPVAQLFPAGETVWFTVTAPKVAPRFRIRETAGANLSIQELYFNTQILDKPVGRQSRAEDVSISQKNIPGVPSTFYVDRAITPVVILWPTPTPQVQTNLLFFTYKRQLQDIGALTDTPQMPARFFEAFVSALAHKFAIIKEFNDDGKGNINKISVLEALAEKSFATACREERERVPIRITPNFNVSI